MKIAIIILDEKDKAALLPKLEKLRENAEDEIFICTHNLDLAREIEEKEEKGFIFSPQVEIMQRILGQM
jgi:ABC-type lipoprotein export system ATPase subunit